MPGFEDLVLAPAIGLVLQQFFEAIKGARGKTKKFDVVLTRLQNTVNSVAPKIDTISRMDQAHDNYMKQEIDVFVGQLEKGKELVTACAEIPRWNKYKKRKYAKRLEDMDASLCKLLDVELQAEQLLFIKRVLLDMAAINKKLDHMNIQKINGSSVNDNENNTPTKLACGVATEGGGSGESSANPTGQSSDDQAGRQPRIEVHFRRKNKEKGGFHFKVY
ncbi:hypothetical protein LWI29_014564 [Acer saccharum]|uniref:RPW8 domain-containing protein n=1 Tax=Acer saccharum TaxID=4024 RepID=A0AA39VZL4_ACESA|nr:hypothetical protein LWI29_014564 [Acer saccharum]KAK1589555.1 hypothetical protein Q3G72_035253 [Acer saccharum]